MESTTSNRLSSAKWSRNLSENSQAEANRLRMMERQRQILETKLQRRHQQSATSSVTMSRPSTSGPVRARTPISSSVVSASTGLASETHDSPLEDSDFDDYEDFDVNHDLDSGRGRSKSSIPGTRKAVAVVQQKIQAGPSPMHSPSQNSTNRFEKKTKQIPKKSAGNLRDYKSMSRSEVNLNSLSSLSESESVKLPSGGEIPNPNPLTTILTEQQLRAYVSEPVSPHVTMQCLIIRDKKGFDRSLYPTYYMHLQDIVINHQSGPKSIEQLARTSLKNNTVDGQRTVTNNSTTAAIVSSDSIDSLESIKSADDPSPPTAIQRRSLETTAGAGIGGGGGVPLSARAKDSSGRKVFMLSGRRRKKSKTYLIGNNAFDISRQHSLAKLKSNVLGTQFIAVRLEPNGTRHEVVSVSYETNVLGFKGPRKMAVIVPKPDEKANPLLNLSLQEEYRRNSRAVAMLKNKTPIWNEETQSYVLNFHGRVTQASVKNFQLVVAATPVHPSGSRTKPEMQRSTSLHQLRHAENNGNSGRTFVDEDEDESEDENDDDSDEDIEDVKERKARQEYASTRPLSKSLTKSGYLSALSSEDAKTLATDPNEHVSLQFGRVSDTHFSCDVSWPLSLIQAFAIALSSFDSKLACE